MKNIILVLFLTLSTSTLFSGDIWLTILTERGQIDLELYTEKAPLTCANFVNLAGRGYYDGITFHRVIADFMIQGGDPTGTGSGSPGYTFEDEFDSSLKHDGPGVLSMANYGPNTNGSQFFITHVQTPWLDNAHTVFGRVLAGQEVVDAIQQEDKINGIIMYGYISEEMEAVQGRIDQFNNILDQNFPNLESAKELSEYLTPLSVDLDIPQVEAFPNPATNSISTEVLEFNPNKFEVFNLNGELILEGETTDAKNINISALNNGLYIIVISAENKKVTSSFIKI